MKTKLTAAVRDLANATASKEGRPISRGVKVNAKEAVAADGFLLVIKPMPAPEMEFEETVDDGIHEVIIPADALKVCKGDKTELETIEAMVKVEKSSLNLEEPKSKIVVRLTGPDYSVEADAIEGVYPEYQKMFQPSKEKAVIALDVNILKKLFKALPDDAVFQIRISEPDKPVEFQCSDPDGDLPIRGLIMPMAISWLHTEWLTDKSKKESK